MIVIREEPGKKNYVEVSSETYSSFYFAIDTWRGKKRLSVPPRLKKAAHYFRSPRQ